MKITAKGGSYITKNEKGGCMSKMKQREKWEMTEIKQLGKMRKNKA
jgi:hypothetical protein